ncbi:hypothetical protein KZY98_10460 [Croceibacter atlanticus]|uniref:Arm DNA-binding domain-containing protein n=1 Tax=Croceibacter atlanticus TaxID=313588 RepID=UPI001C5DDEE5|nr:hypothetical protein [Croceibacter atlanticus]
MRSRSTFSLLFWVETSRIKNGRALIIARITINGKRSNISLKRKVEVARWNMSRSRVDGTSREAVKINRFLDRV